MIALLEDHTMGASCIRGWHADSRVCCPSKTD